jgi:hypothetical protein
VLSTSPGATPLEAAEHVKTHANLWRISDDFWDRWVDIMEMFERCRNWAPHVGNDEFTLSLLTNDEVLAVNQNSANNRELYRRDGLIAWVADAPDSKDKYVALFNTRDAAETASVKVIFETVGLQGRCAVRDLWGRKDLGTFSGEFISPLPSHGAGLYRISPE